MKKRKTLPIINIGELQTDSHHSYIIRMLRILLMLKLCSDFRYTTRSLAACNYTRLEEAFVLSGALGFEAWV